jgi:hypothetical protein
MNVPFTPSAMHAGEEAGALLVRCGCSACAAAPTHVWLPHPGAAPLGDTPGGSADGGAVPPLGCSCIHDLWSWAAHVGAAPGGGDPAPAAVQQQATAPNVSSDSGGGAAAARGKGQAVTAPGQLERQALLERLRAGDVADARRHDVSRGGPRGALVLAVGASSWSNPHETDLYPFFIPDQGGGSRLLMAANFMGKLGGWQLREPGPLPAP